MKHPSNPKERNLIKGAIRRVFSRSELRRLVVDSSRIDYTDATRPRVKKWSYCPECCKETPTYLMEVDHVNPIIRPGESLDDLTWDTLIGRVWCEFENLRAVCKPCHKAKTKLENAERRRLKKEKRDHESAKTNKT